MARNSRVVAPRRLRWFDGRLFEGGTGCGVITGDERDLDGRDTCEQLQVDSRRNAGGVDDFDEDGGGRGVGDGRGGEALLVAAATPVVDEFSVE